MSDIRTRYNTDVYLWSQEQAALLDARQWHALDLPALIEEVLDVGRSVARGIQSAVYQVLVHLLKWRYQSGRRSVSWELSLLEHRRRVLRRLEQAPSLTRELPQMIEAEYPAACRKASLQIGLPRATWPATCPWTVAQVLDLDFLPDAGPEPPCR